MEIQIGTEVQYRGYEWTVQYINEEYNDIRLESDRLNDEQPYWLWIDLDIFLKELKNDPNYYIMKQP